MKYRNWNIKNAKQQINYLVQNNVDGKYDIDIERMNQILDDSIIPFESFCSLKEKLDFDKEKIEEYDYFSKAIEEFYQLTSKIKCSYLYEISLPVSELFTFVNDFFKEALPEWYDIFMEVYKERKNNFRISNKRSYELYISGINYSYINFERKLTIEDLFGIVHEYTHAIVDRIKYRYSYDSKYPFIELPSLASEMIAKDSISHYYTNVNEEIRYYFLGSIASMNVVANDIMLARKFFDTYNLDEEAHIEYYIDLFANFSMADPRALTDKLQLENICYVVPFIYAIELYSLYKKDRELFQYDMNKIITMDNCSNYYQEVKKLGIVPNQNTKSFIKNLKRG